jgi:effector-binding domain-containing protein
MGLSEVRVLPVQPQLIAIVRFRSARERLSSTVPAACGEVWEYFRRAGLPKPGRHVAVYLDGAINVEAGAEVAAPFPENDRVVCSQTPGGLAASVTLFGDYGQLGRAHDAIRSYCASRSHKVAGPNWEVYGHWTDDPSQLRTDVFYLLEST